MVFCLGFKIHAFWTLFIWMNIYIYSWAYWILKYNDIYADLLTTENNVINTVIIIA